MPEVATGKKISLKKFLSFAADPKVISPWCLSEAEDIRKMYAEKKLIIVEAYNPKNSATLGAIAFFVFPPIVLDSGWNTIKKFAYNFGKGLVEACVLNAFFSIGFFIASTSSEISHILILDVYDKMKVVGINTFITDDQHLMSIGFAPSKAGNDGTVYILAADKIKK